MKSNNNDIFKCVACHKTFSAKRNLLKHQTKFHEREKTGSKCPICHQRIPYLSYAEHLGTHGNKPEEKNLQFSSFEEFESWKIKLEGETSSYFVKQTVDHQKRRHYYVCNRSGIYKNQSEGKRHCRIQNTRKINGRCSAFMRVQEIDDQVLVSYIDTHIGHKCELKHLNIPHGDRQTVAGFLSLGISKPTILHRIRASWNDESLRRVHLLSNKDLINISHAFNIDASVKRHKNDLVSVESWIEEMRQSEVNPVILYEEPNDQDSTGFMLGIATEGQKFLLKKYGNNVIAIDSTHGTNDYDFQLTTVMVVDENRNGFPVAFLYSLKVDTDICSRFFQVLKEECGTITTNVFMSDDFSGYYTAWSQVMGPPSHRLLCTWHVLRNWHKHILQIPDQETRNVLKKDLSAVHRELDINEFKNLINYFKGKYASKPNSKKFIEYFCQYYEQRAHQWALCYRLNLGINTNMHLENLHRTLKHVYMSGKKVRRMDESISHLMKLVFNMQFERLRRKEKGFIPKKLEELRQRHKKAEDCSLNISPDIEEPGKWQVFSSSEGAMNIYEVVIDRGVLCDCVLVCNECKLCLRQVSCTCFDFSIRGNFCKHIHYVAMNLDKESAQQSSQDLEPSVVDEVPSSYSHDDEAAILLKSNLSGPSSSREFEHRKRQFVEKMIAIANYCQTVDELSVIEQFTKPMRPTLEASRRSAACSISATTGSQGQGKNIDQQRKFETSKKRKRQKKYQERSTISLDLFNSKQQVAADHDYC